MPSFVSEQSAAELSVRCIILAVLLTLILAMSNAYLALKLGILTSASIPAAIISMGVLRFFKHATILENNAVQTAASAGEAVAGGIVYTIPALVIIGYWQHFDYFTNFFIAASGGMLGVLFSIPLRRILVHDPSLNFPEGRAIAEVLKSSSEKVGVRNLVLGGVVGAVFELLQVGFKIFANSWSYWFVAKRALFGFGAGFSAAMVGAGFLIGQDMALSIFSGAVISWLIALPLLSQLHPEFLTHYPAQQAVQLLWNREMRYLGIGAMLFAGIWTFMKLIKPLARTMRRSLSGYRVASRSKQHVPRVESDMPMPYILIGIGSVAAMLFLFFQWIFPLAQAGLDGYFSPTLIFMMVLYVVVVGFLFSVMTAYFSGMVGVTASPGSSIVIAGILFAAWLLLCVMKWVLPSPFLSGQIIAVEAMTIILGSVVTGIAAIANDNTQDLKVGQLVGATPWKQQLMLLLGVLISSMIIPPVMQLLFNVYGIAGVMPREGMDLSQSLPAPTAALLAAVTEAVFRHTLPWKMMLIGAVLILLVMLCSSILRLQRFVRISILGVAIGMYLPIASSFPLFLGGLMAMFVNWRLGLLGLDKNQERRHRQTGTLIACGLVAGAALMDVFLAIPFSLLHTPDALRLTGSHWDPYAVILSFAASLWLSFWIKRRVVNREHL